MASFDADFNAWNEPIDTIEVGLVILLHGCLGGPLSKNDAIHGVISGRRVRVLYHNRRRITNMSKSDKLNVKFKLKIKIRTLFFVTIIIIICAFPTSAL
jgi:hypothetical protein